MTVKRAPAWRATAAAMMPMGPAPVISTSSPSTGRRARCARRCRRGRRWRDVEVDADRGEQPDVGHRQRDVLGEAPGRFTPTPMVWAHRWRRPARQLRQRPQTTWPSPLTMSPGKKSATLEPTSTIRRRTRGRRHGHGDGLLRPLVPLVDVDVGAADAGAQHLQRRR
jgi:hypothetical protein